MTTGNEQAMSKIASTLRTGKKKKFLLLRGGGRNRKEIRKKAPNEP